MKNNFSRSNVNEETLQISSPLRSGFNMGHRDTVTPQLGRLVPINFEPLLPSDIVQGKLNVDLALEKIMTPRVGRVRMDTHTFVVNARRINKDWQAFIQSKSDATMSSATKPAFPVYGTYGAVLAFLCGSDSVDNTLSEVLFPDAEESPTLDDVRVAIIESVLTTYEEIAFNDTYGDYGYIKDFIAVDYERVTALRTIGTSMNFGDFMVELFSPYFGAASQLDQMGYPIFTNKGLWCTVMNDLTSPSALLALKFSEFFAVNDVGPSGAVINVFDDKYVDEMPLRACYAAWYDYLRNWHVEKRQNILDPDTFKGTSILHPDNLDDGFDYFANVLQLIILKYRMFSRDPLTTVQTDDNFRHVYNPVSSNGFDWDLDGSVSPVDISSDNAIFNSILSEYFNVNSIAAFPSGLFSRFGLSGTDNGVFKSDLQTMRRAGMLRKWLARNYYFPDTYVGMVRARYGIEPGDTSSLISEYIGGTEQFISGNQQIANVGTDDTPVGSRTLVAGVAGDDSFTYHATDYCYMISFVSLVPMVVYDAANMHLQEIAVQDTPDPEFAEDANVEVRTRDFLRGFENDSDVLGLVPRYIQYRCHLDSNHGKFLTDYRDYNWSRDWYNMYFANVSQSSIIRKFSLNPYALRIHLPLHAFLGLDEWDTIAYGDVNVECAIDRALPAAVEVI